MVVALPETEICQSAYWRKEMVKFLVLWRCLTLSHFLVFSFALSTSMTLTVTETDKIRFEPERHHCSVKVCHTCAELTSVSRGVTPGEGSGAKHHGGNEASTNESQVV
jgi:hypothetical protein